jgi:DNA-binding CsgD family transcriptional regulator
MMTILDRVDLRTLLQLEADLSPQSIEGFLGFVRGSYGLAHLAYICPSLGWTRVRDPALALAYSDAWLEHLQVQGQERRGASESSAPAGDADWRASLDWALLPQVKSTIARMLRDVREAGAGRNGLIVPVMGVVNTLSAIFIVTSNEPDIDWCARREDLMKAMVRVAHYVHQRASQLHVPDSPGDLGEISPREIVVLRSLANGNRPSEIAQSMRSSAEVVRTLLESARHKLQALNTEHAIAKALRAGLIE